MVAVHYSDGNVRAVSGHNAAIVGGHECRVGESCFVGSPDDTETEPLRSLDVAQTSARGNRCYNTVVCGLENRIGGGYSRRRGTEFGEAADYIRYDVCADTRPRRVVEYQVAFIARTIGTNSRNARFVAFRPSGYYFPGFAIAVCMA